MAIPQRDILKVAEVAGIMATKRTSELIPLCHPIRLDSVNVRCSLCPEKCAVYIECVVRAREVTGVEMEALQGVARRLCVFTTCVRGSVRNDDRGIRLLTSRAEKVDRRL